MGAPDLFFESDVRVKPVNSVDGRLRRMGAAWTIPAPDARRLPNFTSTTNDPQVMLVILIANQLLIEKAVILKSRGLPTPVCYRVNVAFKFSVVESSPAHGNC